uniref:Secreted protein n=1 Tax=Anopheles darlingi TaxID=43151 RepID=A0A2M4DEU9_ANODA
MPASSLVLVLVAALALVLVAPAPIRTFPVVLVVVVLLVPAGLLCHRPVPTVLQRSLPKALAKLWLPVAARIPAISNAK